MSDIQDIILIEGLERVGLALPPTPKFAPDPELARQVRDGNEID